MRLKLEHALLVRTCDVFLNSPIFRIYQVGSVGPF